MFSILHIEQSKLIKHIVNSEFSSFEVDYYGVENSKEAFLIIDEKRLDLIITSTLINGATLEELIHHVSKSINANTPIFIVTSNEISDKMKSVLNLGISDYIMKDNLILEISKRIEILKQQNVIMEFLKNSNIAIIDDSRLEREFIKNLLSKRDITNVDTFSSGAEALNSSKIYQVYIIDAVLKNEYGNSVVMQIRRGNIDAAIMVVSSLHNPKTIASLFVAGADEYISKPIDEMLFIAKLKSTVRHYSLLKK